MWHFVQPESTESVAVHPVIDSHCHLDFPVLDHQRNAVLTRAEAAGVQAIIVPAVETEGFAKVAALADSHRHIYCALGLHPCFMPSDSASACAALAQALNEFSPCAVGEIGLDFFIPQHDKTAQLMLLEQQLQLAEAADLPVILHVRKAHDEMLKLLRTRQVAGGIVHAFNGSAQQARQYINLGFKLGFGGVITYPRARKIRELARTLPLQALVLETDAPDMPLAGRQGQPNEPAFVASVLNELAIIRSEPLAEIARQTCRNVRQVLRLPVA